MATPVTMTTAGAPPNKLLLLGATYPHRETIKAQFGGRWNPELSGWLVDSDRVLDVDDWIAQLPRPAPKQRLCSNCREPGHTRPKCTKCERCKGDHNIKDCTVCGLCSGTHNIKNCDYTCPSCGVVGKHMQSSCQHYITQKDPNWKRCVGPECRCSPTRVCSLCRYACCADAVQEHCVCLYSYSCKTHNINYACHGTHD